MAYCEAVLELSKWDRCWEWAQSNCRQTDVNPTDERSRLDDFSTTYQLNILLLAPRKHRMKLPLRRRLPERPLTMAVHELLILPLRLRL